MQATAQDTAYISDKYLSLRSYTEVSTVQYNSIQSNSILIFLPREIINYAAKVLRGGQPDYIVLSMSETVDFALNKNCSEKHCSNPISAQKYRLRLAGRKIVLLNRVHYNLYLQHVSYNPYIRVRSHPH